MRVLAEGVGVGVCRMSYGKGHVIIRRLARVRFGHTEIAAVRSGEIRLGVAYCGRILR